MELRLNSTGCAVGQIMLVLCTLAAIAAAPPVRGTMLLVSVNGLNQGAILNHARHAGALPAGPGPTAGSLLVIAERGSIALAMLQAGIITLGAPDALCSRRKRG